MGFIYTITNKINGKQYVGKTNLPNPQDRWKEHCKDYTRRKLEHRPLYSAMNNYGVENFVFEVIEECDNTEEREKFWIKKLNTYGSTGYNATLGGDGKTYIQYSDEEIIEYHCGEGKYISTRTAQHFGIDEKSVSNRLRKYNIKKVDTKTIMEIRSFENKMQMCMLDDNGQIIEVFRTAYVAAKYLGHETGGKNIVYAAKLNKDKFPAIATSYGYKWKYLKDMPDDCIQKQYFNM